MNLQADPLTQTATRFAGGNPTNPLSSTVTTARPDDQGSQSRPNGGRGRWWTGSVEGPLVGRERAVDQAAAVTWIGGLRPRPGPCAADSQEPCGKNGLPGSD